MLAPFRTRAFRYQWPADLATSWAVEMEVLILGWYILVESESVVLLVFFGALQYLGSFISPLFGVAGDRLGYGRLLWTTRGMYAVTAALLGLLAAGDALTPTAVLIIAGLNGLVRPSDLVMRYALIAQHLPAPQLMGALGIARITSDTARIAGALAGAGAVAMFGMAPAYLAVTLLYVLSFLLSMQVEPGSQRRAGQSSAQAPAPSVSGAAPHSAGSASPSPWRDLLSGAHYVWQRPALLGGLSMAFLINLLAFPLFIGLLPYLAKNIYGVGQAGLGWLGASFAFGALLGSLLLSSNRLRVGAARLMLMSGLAWLLVNVVQAQTTDMLSGMACLMLSGFVQSLCMTPLAAVMLRATEPAYRGRVMGIRILGILGLPLGLMLAGPLIQQWGFQITMTAYAICGILLTLAMALYWRQVLWLDDKPI